MMKYAVYLFDGTLQEQTQSEARDWSNIVRLHKLLHASPPVDGILLDLYGDGVGCRGNEFLLGSTAGIGLDKRVEEAFYDLGGLVHNAREDGDDLRVYVFGFSRGAYAARIFCELVSFCGAPGDGSSFGGAMKCLERRDAATARKWVGEGKFLPPPGIDLLGLFDTVAMTEFGHGVDISILPANVHHACHAMSYNERRTIFPLMRFASGQDRVEEVWFLGSHTDVGGGYVKRGLADRSLEWMIEMANAHGLPIKATAIDGDAADHAVAFNDSSMVPTKNRIARAEDVFHWSVQEERNRFENVEPPLPPPNTIAYSPRSSVDTISV